jgi:hypothetical protein
MYKPWSKRSYKQRQRVRYLCEQVADYDNPGEHTSYVINYTGYDGRSAAYISAYRNKKCDHCGGAVVIERDWARLRGLEV